MRGGGGIGIQEIYKFTFGEEKNWEIYDVKCPNVRGKIIKL